MTFLDMARPCPRILASLGHLSLTPPPLLLLSLAQPDVAKLNGLLERHLSMPLCSQVQEIPPGLHGAELDPAFVQGVRNRRRVYRVCRHGEVCRQGFKALCRITHHQITGAINQPLVGLRVSDIGSHGQAQLVERLRGLPQRARGHRWPKILPSSP